jgi:hypothetical protein
MQGNIYRSLDFGTLIPVKSPAVYLISFQYGVSEEEKEKYIYALSAEITTE